jgi:hypothetical protein
MSSKMEGLARVSRALTLAAIVLLIVPRAAGAQAVTGTLLGNINDSSGGTVPGATVTATEVKTNTSRTVVSNENGYYIFSSLQNGVYDVTAELQGFRKIIRKDVKVDVNTTVRVDLTLEVGQMSEAVTVTAESPVLQTDRTDTGRIIESKMVSELPLTFNRNFQSLMMTVPGVTRPHREHSQFFNSQDSLRFEVNGQPGMASNTLIEGLDNNQKTGLLQVIIPAADALETVNVTTSNYDAEFGRSGGAVTNVTIKSGTNAYKGSAFVFGNTDATNASDYFTHLRAPTKFLNSGFTLGGPIVRSKLFFFGDYQRTIDNLGYAVRATVPTVRMRNGDFGEVSTRIYDPLTGDVSGNGRTAFANNQIPQNRISPIARSLLAFIPEPNIPGAALGQNNYQKAQTREKTTDGFDAKVNYSINEKDQASFRVSFMRPVVFDPGVFGQYGGPANGGFAGDGTNTSWSGAATWTRVFSQSTLLDVRGGLNYYHNVTKTQGHGLTTSAEVGIPGANLDDYTSGVSSINIGGHSNPLLGFSSSQPWDRSEKTWSVTSVLTRLLGSHTLKVGGEWRHNRDLLLQTQDAGGPRGAFTFNASGTGNPAETATLSGVANAMASFLLDWPNGVQRDLKVFDEPGTKHWATFLFVHDKWQFRPNVTLDLGLRWEYYNPLEGLAGAGSLSNYDDDADTARPRLQPSVEALAVARAVDRPVEPRDDVDHRRVAAGAGRCGRFDLVVATGPREHDHQDDRDDARGGDEERDRTAPAPRLGDERRQQPLLCGGHAAGLRHGVDVRDEAVDSVHVASFRSRVGVASSVAASRRRARWSRTRNAVAVQPTTRAASAGARPSQAQSCSASRSFGGSSARAARTSRARARCSYVSTV